MKTKILFLTVVLTGAVSFAQAPPSGVISHLPEAGSRMPIETTDKSEREIPSRDQIAVQLRELRRTVNETLPLLNTLMESETNSTAAGHSGLGALAGILGNVLRGNTNQVSESASRATNKWSGILREVIGTNSTASASSETETLSDLAALRDQLRSLAPILERLDSSALSKTQWVRPSDRYSTNNLAPTGRE